MRRDVLSSPEQNLLSKNQQVLNRIFDWNPEALLLVDMNTGCILKTNQPAEELFGYSRGTLLGVEMEYLLQFSKEIVSVWDSLKEYSLEETVTQEVLGRRKQGGVFSAEVHCGQIDETSLLIRIVDICHHEEFKLLQREFADLTFLHEQYYLKMKLGKRILRMVAEQLPLQETLHVLCEGIEGLVTGIRASVCTITDNALLCQAAPSMPSNFAEAVKGSAIIPEGLPCARAIYYKQQFIVEDMLNNASFAPFHETVASFDIQSCWSIPIVSSQKKEILGTFAFYSNDPYFPQHAISDLIIVAIDLAEIAIKQAQNRDALLKINQQYIEQNKELEQAKEQLEKDKALLLDREEKLKEAQRQTKVGSWDYHIATEEMVWSRQQYQTYGLEPLLGTDLFKAYQACIYPTDRDNCRLAIQEVCSPDTHFQYEHRILAKDGSTRYILGTGEIERDEQGQIVHLKGTEQDVTALKEAQEATVRHERQFNELIANINEIVFMVTVKDHQRYTNPITYINGDTLGIFGYTHEELMESPTLWTERIHSEDLAEVIRKGKELHTTREKVTREYRFQHKDGHYLWIEDNLSVGRSEEDGENRLYGSARDVSIRKKAEEASKEIQERLELAQDAANLGSYDWKVTSNQLHWDKRMHELFGLDEKIGKTLNKNEYVNSIMHPEDRDRGGAYYLSNLSADKRINNFKNSYRIILEGKIKHIESYIIFIRDEEGKVDRIIGTCLDVTERKEAEALSTSNEEKAVLLKEIHHRVKNNLQVITSLLSLQSSNLRYPEQRQIFADSQYRINSMAIVHELLYQSDNLSRVNYRDYLTKLSQFLIRSIKGTANQVQLDLDIENVQLDIDTAIPLGLLINEVLTNSLKYGIPDDKAGTIVIRLIPLMCRDESKKQSYRLEIGDDGIGYPESINHQTTQSLGLKLIYNLTRQLAGTINRDHQKQGTNYIITFKEA